MPSEAKAMPTVLPDLVADQPDIAPRANVVVREIPPEERPHAERGQCVEGTDRQVDGGVGAGLGRQAKRPRRAGDGHLLDGGHLPRGFDDEPLREVGGRPLAAGGE
jgi:hypothetical protein